MRSELSRFSVLLVTDDRHLQRIATWILIEAGFYAAFCETVSAALEQTESLEPDVIVFDTPLGAQKLVDAERLRAGFPAARLVGLHQQNDGVEAHIQCECHLHKPFTAEDLVACIDEALAASVGTLSTHSH